MPKTRNAPSISLDRQSVQRLAAEALAGHRQVFSFHLQVRGLGGGGGAGAMRWGRVKRAAGGGRAVQLLPGQLLVCACARCFALAAGAVLPARRPERS